MYKFVDLSYVQTELKSELNASFERVMGSGQFIGGDEVEKFEHEFAEYCGARHCVGVASGLDALVLSLRAMDIGIGDEVIVPANTFIATWLAISHVGARIVPVDADSASLALNIEQLEKAITKRTRAILPVHLYGVPAPLAELQRIADRNGLRMLEDAAQSHGACYKGMRIGSSNDAVAFSFYPTKNLGAFGDGGCVTTNDSNLADKIRQLANYGSASKSIYESRGYNSRLDPLQAAFLRVKLPKLDQWNQLRRNLADVYTSSLQRDRAIRLPSFSDETVPVWHLYPIQVPHRATLRARLARRGVETAVHYCNPIHKTDAYCEEFGRISLPVTEALCESILSLPMGPHLRPEDCKAVAEIVLEETARGR